LELVRSCEACQFHMKWIHTLAQMMQMILPSWPFAVWGLDIVGLFPKAIRGFRYLYITIDKFTKWPEATPVVKINKQSTVKFIKSIICRFGAPNRIITDNGSQFTSSAFQGYCKDLGIHICYVSIVHPKSNGQVQRANTKILKGLKTRTYDCLKKHGAKWIDELPCKLCTNRTSSSQAMGEMPFFLVYGTEVVIPSEVTMVSPHVKAYDKAAQD
jgi:transposase InsO family protein